MTTMNISLPQQMKDWVEAQSKDGRYANSSDYVRDLIRRDAERRAKIAAMNEKLRDGEASGYTEIDIDTFFADLRTRLLK